MNEIKKYRYLLKSNVGLVDDISYKEKKKPRRSLQKYINQNDKIAFSR